MSGDGVHQNERQAILTRLLDAVKQCQVRFGGRSELATDSDSRVSCLCAAWETALQHGMKKNSKALSAFKQMTERAGLTKVTDLFSDIKRIETDPVFWHYAKEHLTKHEFQRFNKLKLVNTDTGRGRAWLRASLNEHSLERYMHMLIENDDLLSQQYEDWAFLRDLERSSMLPNMAAGLGSILFAITVDRPELNKGYTAQNSIHVQNSIDSAETTEKEEDPKPVISGEVSPVSAKRKEKKKKKKVANVVSFDEDDTVGTVITKSGSTSSATHLPESVARELQLNGETRENGEGTQEDNVFVTENEPQEESLSKSSETAAVELAAQREKTTPSLVRDVSQVSTSSVMSASLDRLSKSSTGSFSDLDHDNGTFMAPVGADGMVVDTEMVPYSGDSSGMSTSQASFDAVDYPGHGDMESASLALALAQQSLSDSGRTDGDGGSPQEPRAKKPTHDSMSEGELKQAVVAMMLRKDSVEEQNRKLEGMLQHEMETSSTLRAEIEELKVQHASRHEKEQAKIQALQKENELLKHQLKKYVNAVQMLRTEGINKEDSLGIHLEEPQPSLPPPKPNIDYSHEAAEYEKKLIQVAEMHGELMEFNELLHRQLNGRDNVLRQLREELVLLRGPLPYDRKMSVQTGQEIENMGLQHTLINIWIPSAFLRGSSNNTHHVYQVYIRIRDEEWNVYRRYNQFLDMHQRLRKVYPIIGKFEFPPKKAIGKKDAKLVESRRQVFQTYLRNVINVMMEKNDQLASSSCKERLVSYLPFFNDKAEEGSKKGKKGKRSSVAPTTIPVSVPEGAASGSRNDGEQVPDQYQGL
ncbi:sorting nexin-29 isoform X2 [Aplysia californica]|uniref:Sorting nexin-29 isoform X2 n=1 Tax=Aplysia californica TaxID=6500 RepID=A0ABM0K4L5_APLCA|nr:sorting nexin-29 isoform X2 [Aplysia californica]